MSRNMKIKLFIDLKKDQKDTKYHILFKVQFSYFRECTLKFIELLL